MMLDCVSRKLPNLRVVVLAQTNGARHVPVGPDFLQVGVDVLTQVEETVRRRTMGEGGDQVNAVHGQLW